MSLVEDKLSKSVGFFCTHTCHARWCCSSFLAQTTSRPSRWTSPAHPHRWSLEQQRLLHPVLQRRSVKLTRNGQRVLMSHAQNQNDVSKFPDKSSAGNGDKTTPVAPNDYKEEEFTDTDEEPIHGMIQGFVNDMERVLLDERYNNIWGKLICASLWIYIHSCS